MATRPPDAMDHATEQLILDVIDGNPGACVIVYQILSSPVWRSILHALKAKHVVGSRLWQVVHDDYNDDWQSFVQAVLKVHDN